MKPVTTLSSVKQRDDIMDITYLKEFVVLADVQNFTRAADELYVSQPVLSKHIKYLEQELGAKLFIRSAKGIYLTEFGKMYLPFAKKIADIYYQSEKKRKDYIAGLNNVVHFGVIEDLHLYEFQEYMTAFTSRYPEYRFKLIETFSNKSFDMFKQGAYKIFGTAIFPGESPDYCFSPIASGSVKAIIRKDHRLAGSSSISICDLAEETVVLPARSIFLSFINPVLNKLLPEKDDYVYSSYSAARAMVESDSYIGLLQQEALNDPLPEDIKVMDTIPHIPYIRGMAYKDRGLNEAERAFTEFVINYKRE